MNWNVKYRFVVETDTALEAVTEIEKILKDYPSCVKLAEIIVGAEES